MVLPRKTKVYIEYSGCPNRGIDATRFEHYFMQNGCRVIKSPGLAEHILYISCAFSQDREDRAIKRIKELDKYRGRLIVAGCLKGINKKRLDENFKGLSLVTADHNDIDILFPEFKVGFSAVKDGNNIYRFNLLRFLKENLFVFRFDLNFIKRVLFYFRRRDVRNYCYIRIASGCEKEHCRFCVIWQAIGALRSKHISICLNELQLAVKKGIKTIVLTANNSGAYGLDINSSLPELLKAILSVEGDFRIEIEDLHPVWLIRYADELALLIRSGKISVLHCPVQSGSDRMLGFMNRRHTKAELKDAWKKLKSAWSELQINTHILVGFSTETADDFRQTLALLRDIRPGLVHIHGYSINQHIRDTEVLDNVVSPAVIHGRLQEAIRFCRKNKIVCSLA
ncbi:MAG: radical SAM protein [Candidatus Omnitrophota bacterium]